MTRWWWETFLTRDGEPRLSRCVETGPRRGSPPPVDVPGPSGLGVATQDVRRWIDHLEGLPPR